MVRASMVGVVLVAQIASGIARADTVDRPAALRFANEGHALYRAGHFADAASALERAYARYPEPVLLYDLGRARQRNGDTTLAVDAFRRYLAIAAPDARERADAERQLTVLETSPPVEVPVEPAVPEPPKPPQPVVVSAVPLAPIVVASPPPHRPLYRRWWLWTTVGAVAVGVGLGVGLGLWQHPITRYPSPPSNTPRF